MVEKLFVAMKAFVVYDGKVLLIKESSKYSDEFNAGKFDVVGGRVNKGERFEACLIREIKEETGLDVRIGKPFFVNEWRPVVNGEEWQIIGMYFECFSDSDEVKLSEDHEEFIWIDPEKFNDYEIIDNMKKVFEGYLDR